MVKNGKQNKDASFKCVISKAEYPQNACKYLKSQKMNKIYKNRSNFLDLDFIWSLEFGLDKDVLKVTAP